MLVEAVTNEMTYQDIKFIAQVQYFLNFKFALWTATKGSKYFTCCILSFAPGFSKTVAPVNEAGITFTDSAT